MPSLSDTGSGVRSCLGDFMGRIIFSRIMTDFRNYYRFTLVMLAITLTFEVICLLMAFILIQPISVIYITFLCGLSAFLIFIVSVLLRYSQKPDSDHLLASGQFHTITSIIVALIMFAYAASQRAPFAAMRTVCHNQKGYPAFCLLTDLLYVFAFATPFAMSIASWILWIKAVNGGFRIISKYNVSELDEARIQL